MTVQNGNPAAGGYTASGAGLVSRDNEAEFTSNRQRKKVRKEEAISAVLELLAERWPQTFSIYEGRRFRDSRSKQKSRPLHKAAYTDRSCPELSAHVGDALLGICLASGRWVRRQLKHRCLLTPT
jgi:hypothetical protein